MTIRDATLADVPALTVLAANHIATSPVYSGLPIDNGVLSDNLTSDITSDTAYTRVYVDANGDIKAGLRAYIGSFYMNNYKYIPDVMLVVDPASSGMGYGAKLMLDLHAYSLSNNIHTILFIDTSDINNASTSGLVTGLGYTQNSNVFRGDVVDLQQPPP